MIRIAWHTRRYWKQYCATICFLYIIILLYPSNGRRFINVQTLKHLSMSKFMENNTGEFILRDFDPSEGNVQKLRDEPIQGDDTERIYKNYRLHLNHWRNFTLSEINKLSAVGRRVYLKENIGEEKNRNFTILIWRSGEYAAPRMTHQFGPVYIDPFETCSAKNCFLTYNDSLSDIADAVVIHLHVTPGPQDFPNRTNFEQRWVWWTDEAPPHTFMISPNKDLRNYNGYFNWSMTYRADSDVPVPYGVTIELTEEEAASAKIEDYFNLKPKNVATMASNCHGANGRFDYIRELKEYTNVDFYGGCGNLECPGHFFADCNKTKDYKFYLAFENINCDEYITEKVWWSALKKGGIPVVMGGKIEKYRKMLPPNSFIHIDEFDSPKHLGEYINSVGSDREKYMSYHAWRLKFRVSNEHGYFQSPIFHYCRICEALNYNDPAPKVYNNMETFWNMDTDCYPSTWNTKNHPIK